MHCFHFSNYSHSANRNFSFQRLFTKETINMKNSWLNDIQMLGWILSENCKCRKSIYESHISNSSQNYLFWYRITSFIFNNTAFHNFRKIFVIFELQNKKNNFHKCIWFYNIKVSQLLPWHFSLPVHL